MYRKRDVRGLAALLVAVLCLAALALVQGSPAPSDTAPVAYTPPRVSPFTDVPGTSSGQPHTFYGEIAWLSERGISTGYSAPGGPFFDPGAPVLREQMAAFLYRLAGEPPVDLPAASPFIDLPTTHPFYKHVVWLQSTGVTTGYVEPGGASTFRGSQPVLREQMAAFLFRFQTWKKGGTVPVVYTREPLPFSDVSSAAAFSREIRWLAQADVTRGYIEPGGTSTFRPAQPVLREQMAAFMFRFDALDGPAPVVTSLSATTSPLTGGQTIVIRGKNFVPSGSTYVSFGNSRAAYSITSPFLMTAVVPRTMTAGVVKVSVTTPEGTSTPVDFEYVVPGTPAPVVTAVSPNEGPMAGGSTVTLHGTRLTGITSVMFGATPATSITEFDGSFARVVAPPAAASGAVVVTVTTAGGAYGGPTFTYKAPPATGPLAGTPVPRWGGLEGGTKVTINGQRLTDVVSVRFGMKEADSVTVVSATQITAVTPPGLAAGSTPVTVTTSAGLTTQASPFYYTEVSGPPVVTSMTPSSGDLRGISSVEIIGEDLVDVESVTVGGRPASFSIVNATKLMVTPPPWPEEASVPVVVTTRRGSATNTPLYTYVLAPVTPEPGPPRITTSSVSPATVGETYVHQLLTSDHRPGRWEVSAGRLPAGLVIDGDRLRGVPTFPGLHPVTLTFTDERGQVGSAPVTLFVGVPRSERGLSTGTTSMVDGPGAGSLTSGTPRTPSVSADGRYVAYSSSASDLVPGDTNAKRDVFVTDTATGLTDIVSTGQLGVPGDGDASNPAISADGRFVAFTSAATNLVPGDTNQKKDVFVHDRVTRSTTLVSSPAPGVPSDGDAGTSTTSISSDGRFVVFGSLATTMVPGRTVEPGQAYRHDRVTGTTAIVSASADGTPGNGQGQSAVLGDTSMSDDGRYVAFTSNEPSITRGTDTGLQVVVKDMVTGTLQMVSLGQPGHAQHPSAYGSIDMSADGRLVVFDSYSSLLPGVNNNSVEVYSFDRQTSETRLVSFTRARDIASAGGGVMPTISADGRYVAFASGGPIVWGDGPLSGQHVYVRDLLTGYAQLVSLSSGGRVADAGAGSSVISADGRRIAFVSSAQNLALAPGAPNRSHVYLHDRASP